MIGTIERRLEIRSKIYLTFIDLEKAFGKVECKILFKMLNDYKLNWIDCEVVQTAENRPQY